MGFHYIENINKQSDILKHLLSEIRVQPRLSIDTETTGLDPYFSKILLIQIKTDSETFVLNRHKLGDEFTHRLISLIENSRVMCIGHNIKFDMKMIAVDTGIMLTNVYDTMIVEAIITAGLGGKFISLKELVQKYCGVVLEKEVQKEFIGLTVDTVFTEQQILYSATDVLYLDDIYKKQMEIASRDNLLKIVELESRVEPVVALMELEGIKLDIPHWNALTESAKKEASALGIKLKDVLFNAIPTDKYENAFQFATAVSIPVKTKRLTAELEKIVDPEQAKEWIKNEFNLNSPKQLTTALNLAGIKVISTDEKVLNKLDKDEIIDTLLEYRGYEKMISTYGDNFVAAINPVTGKIHPDFNQLGTASGRFSSGGGDRTI